MKHDMKKEHRSVRKNGQEREDITTSGILFLNVKETNQRISKKNAYTGLKFSAEAFFHIKM